MKKVTIPQQAVVFGSDAIATKWAKKHGVPKENVILATHPDRVEAMEGPMVVVRVTEEEWKPTTFPDEKRVAETEKILKRHKRKGEEVQEAELIDTPESVSEEP